MSRIGTLDARWGRAYFGLQFLAGAAWWAAVPALPLVRSLTLGQLPAGLVAAFDIPLFVIASGLAAIGIRGTAMIATAWTVLVAAGMAAYATMTGMAGWGALLMVAAAGGSGGALLLVQLDRLPSELLIVGPFAARPSRSASAGRQLLRTAGQITVFWGVFLVVIPASIAFFEERWGLRVPFPSAVAVGGGVLLASASALGIWSAVDMARCGDGTPLPVATARRLVVSGPYRFVRNPMAVAGIAQGVAVGMLCGSWLVVVYALSGSLVWNHLIRPWEEKDLLDRFGVEYEAYRDRVSCWIPHRPLRSRGERARAVDDFR